MLKLQENPNSLRERRRGGMGEGVYFMSSHIYILFCMFVLWFSSEQNKILPLILKPCFVLPWRCLFIVMVRPLTSLFEVVDRTDSVNVCLVGRSIGMQRTIEQRKSEKDMFTLRVLLAQSLPYFELAEQTTYSSQQ